MAFPDSEATASGSPALQGSVFGGHAPIVGAKVYVLTPSINAYGGSGIAASGTATAGNAPSGNLSRSLMCGDDPATTCTGGSSVTAGGQSGYHYVTTDATGSFNLGGDYTCSVNQAVYLVAVGGSPSYPSNTNAFTVVNPSVSNNGDGTATFTYNTTTQEEFYAGETVVVSGFPSIDNGFNMTGTVVAANLTTNTFSFVTTYSGSYGTANGVSGAAVAAPTANPAIINATAVGLCPANGTFNGTVSFIYMNEVSTTALAYGLAGFGTDAFHIGVATGTGSNAATNTYQSAAYALNGLKQGLSNAGLLYDIQGGNISTVYAGEGHIARATTPPYSGTSSNGTVPQATLDTIGNILAACVDSQNTASSASAQCTKLFANATVDGTTGGTKPTDIATAAFNIAHFPAGTANSSFVANLMSIPTGNIPFAPNLSANPNDFTVALAFTAPTSTTNSTNLINGPAQISIDGSGNEGVWISNGYTQPVKLFAATGFPDFTTNNYISAYGDATNIAIDLSGNAWLSLGTELVEVPNSPTSAVPTLTSPQNFSGLTWATIDTTGSYLYATDTATANTNNLVGEVRKIRLSDGINVDPTNASNITNATHLDEAWSAYVGGNFASCLSGNIYTNTVDFNGAVYIASSKVQGLCVARSNATSYNNYASFNGASGIAGAMDKNRYYWGATGTSTSNGTALQEFNTYSFTSGSFSNGAGSGNKGGLSGASSTAVDGNNNIWIGNQGGGVAAFNPASGNWLSPANGFAPGLPGVATNGSFPAIDRAGDVWLGFTGASSGTITQVYEIIGLAAPTITPLSTTLNNQANGRSGIGAKP